MVKWNNIKMVLGDILIEGDHMFKMNALFKKLKEQNVEGAFLVMDNVPFHKTNEVKAFIEAEGHHSMFLPPNSPFLNPIEEVFS